MSPRDGIAWKLAVVEDPSLSGSVSALGRMGSVLATDTNTRFLAALDYPWLEVRTYDIITDTLPAAEFDLVHTRLVLTYLPERERVLEKMAKAVKPAGRGE